MKILQLIRSILSNSICEAHTSETERSIIEMLSMVDGLDETVILNLAEKASLYIIINLLKIHLIRFYVRSLRN